MIALHVFLLWRSVLIVSRCGQSCEVYGLGWAFGGGVLILALQYSKKHLFARRSCRTTPLTGRPSLFSISAATIEPRTRMAAFCSRTSTESLCVSFALDIFDHARLTLDRVPLGPDEIQTLLHVKLTDPA